MSKKKELNYEDYSNIRKQGHIDGTIPEWMATAGVQLFYKNYLYQAANPKEQFQRIAKTLAQYSPIMVSPSDNVLYLLDKKAFQDYWEKKFFDIMWKGYFACSTPLLANTGTDRGLPVSCSGGIMIEDSVDGFYTAAREVALLTKAGFGTAVDVSNIRHRGSHFKGGGVATGVLPVMKLMDSVTSDVSQGSSRRGACASYMDIHHKDFHEVADYLYYNPDKLNVGWKVNDKFVEKLDNGNKEAQKRFAKSMHVKSTVGKGYYYFPDKANRLKGAAYEKNNLNVSSTQLCTEVMLHSDEDHTYICTLGWMNASKYMSWKDTDAVFVATVLLDCVNSYFIEEASKISGLEKAVRGAIKGRPIGLGCGGLSTLFQQEMLPYESIEAYQLAKEMFMIIEDETLKASKILAIHEGEPEWCEGLGIRNTHLRCIAPTKSTAAIYGGIGEGIAADVAFSYTQSTAGGEVARVSPVLLSLIKSNGLNVEECISDVEKAKGSVQRVSWLTDKEKSVFKTGFELPQESILRLVSMIQRHIDQGISLNLFVDKRHNEEYISKIHQMAFKDPYIKSLYYLIGKREGLDENETVEVPESCESCQ
jgi:ribonucleoside-diphosphate reductase alpha chain